MPIPAPTPPEELWRKGGKGQVGDREHSSEENVLFPCSFEGATVIDRSMLHPAGTLAQAMQPSCP